MMRKNFMVPAVALLALTCCSFPGKKNKEVVIKSDTLKYCESTYILNDRLLVANFGSAEMDPLNKEGRGYVLIDDGGIMKPLIAPDGNLSAPRGMFSRNSLLYICDVDKVVVYNLDSLQVAPQIIKFTKDDSFVNDIIGIGNNIYVTVTNTGRIYKVDISDPAMLDVAVPELWCSVPGPNGIATDGEKVYVASYPPDGKVSDQNGIYVINDIEHPLPEIIVEEPGMYDGIAVSPDKKTLYITNWSPAGIYSVDLTSADKKPEKIKLNTEVIGAADITLHNDTLYIPDLAQSRVIIYPLK